MTHLDLYTDNPEILKQLVSQVNKDLEMFGIVELASESAVIDLDQILDQLKRTVSGLLDDNPDKLWALLYYIDLDQKVLSQTRADQQETNPAALIAELILQRELTRLISLLHYKHNQDTK